MKLHEDFLLCPVGEELTLVPVGEASHRFYGILRANNDTAKVILHCLQQETTPEAIVDTLREQFEGDPAQMRESVLRLLEQLRQRGALRE